MMRRASAQRDGGGGWRQPALAAVRITSGLRSNFTRRFRQRWRTRSGKLLSRAHQRRCRKVLVRSRWATMLRWLARAAAWRPRFRNAVRLSVGMRDDVVGPAYLARSSNPRSAPSSTRLGSTSSGEACRLRSGSIAALSLLSPFAGAVHQHGLRGDGVRPLSLPALCGSPTFPLWPWSPPPAAPAGVNHKPPREKALRGRSSWHAEIKCRLAKWATRTGESDPSPAVGDRRAPEQRQWSTS